jgi:mRNA interferase RelE/StbE
MASYNVRWKLSAKKELKKLPKETILKVLAVIEKLPENPFPKQCRKLAGSERSYRIRSGKYRIAYSILSDELTIEIQRIGHRKDIYKNLI